MALGVQAKASICAGIALVAGNHAVQTHFSPLSWAVCSLSTWLAFVVCKGWANLSRAEIYQLMWALASTGFWLHFITNLDPSFKSWGSVYYFCGDELQYCRCNLRWNLAGWAKACFLWNFVLAAALGWQKLIIQVGLGGLLAGEEVVTKESFVSIAWRLVPYWVRPWRLSFQLNNWEQQWGAECSSMLFELPHYALELLVVLPLVQIISARLRILANPVGRGLLPPHEAPSAEDVPFMAPDILKGVWRHDPLQRKFLPRLRNNSRVMFLVALVAGLAAFNCLFVPLALERSILQHPRTPQKPPPGALSNWLVGPHHGNKEEAVEEESAAPDLPLTGTPRGGAKVTGEEAAGPELPITGVSYLSSRLQGRLPRQRDSAGRKAFAQAFQQESPSMLGMFEASGRCNASSAFLERNLEKHAKELEKVWSPGRGEAIMLVEATLAVMRLSCEKFFVLASVLAAYLLFRDEVPGPAVALIRFNHRVSTWIQRVILYTFPALCWVYGAGILFSTFASFVFWAGPVQQLVEATRQNATTVQPLGLKDANEEELERMNGSCAVCWGDMGPAAQPPPEAEPRSKDLGAEAADSGEEEESGEPGGSGQSLPCGHAFHRVCIKRWLKQCHTQSRKATCPMCNAAIELEVKWRPLHLWRGQSRPVPPGRELQGRAAIQAELQALLDENPTGLHFNPHAAAGAAWHEEVAADPARQHAVRQGEAGEAPREAVHEAAAAAREAIRGAGSTAARHGADVHTLPQASDVHEASSSNRPVQPSSSVGSTASIAQPQNSLERWQEVIAGGSQAAPASSSYKGGPAMGQIEGLDASSALERRIRMAKAADQRLQENASRDQTGSHHPSLAHLEHRSA